MCKLKGTDSLVIKFIYACFTERYKVDTGQKTGMMMLLPVWEISM